MEPTAMCGFVTIIGRRDQKHGPVAARRLTAWQGQTIGWERERERYRLRLGLTRNTAG